MKPIIQEVSFILLPSIFTQIRCRIIITMWEKYTQDFFLATKKKRHSHLQGCWCGVMWDSIAPIVVWTYLICWRDLAKMTNHHAHDQVSCPHFSNLSLRVAELEGEIESFYRVWV